VSIGLLKNVMQQIGRALFGRQPFQHEKERRAERSRQFQIWRRSRNLDRLGKPGTDVIDALAIRRTQKVEAAPSAHGREPRRGTIDSVPVGLAPLDEAILHHVLGVRARAENAVSEPHEAGARLLEDGEVIAAYFSHGGSRHGKWSLLWSFSSVRRHRGNPFAFYERVSQGPRSDRQSNDEPEAGLVTCR